MVSCIIFLSHATLVVCSSNVFHCIMPVAVQYVIERNNSIKLHVCQADRKVKSIYAVGFGDLNASIRLMMLRTISDVVVPKQAGTISR
jgi:hypothetical protein